MKSLSILTFIYFFCSSPLVSQENLTIKNYKRYNNTLQFECQQSQTGKIFYGQFSFPYPNVFHFLVIPHSSDSLVKQSGNLSFFNLEEADERLILKTEDLTVTINKQGLVLKLRRNLGPNLFSGRLKIGRHPESNSNILQLNSDIQTREKFYGFGERLNGFNQRNNRIVMELSDAWGESGQNAYKSVPFYFSSRNYAFLEDSHKRIIFDMGNQSKDTVEMIMPEQRLNSYVFASKSPIDIMKQYTKITGKSPSIPAWSLEPWLSRRGMTGWDHPGTVEDQVNLSIAHGIYFGVVLWEGIRKYFGKHENPSAADMVNSFHQRDIKVVRWAKTGQIKYNDSNEKKYHFNREPYKNYFVKEKSGKLLKTNRYGRVYNPDTPDSSSTPYIFIDVTNKKAMNWWFSNKYEGSFTSDEGNSTAKDHNLDGVKLDFSERFPHGMYNLEMVDPKKGLENEYPVMLGEEIYKYLQKIRPEGGIIWQRGGGMGLQKAGPVWNGDRLREFSQLKGTMESLLSASTSGIALAGHDLGGYMTWDNPFAQEVYIRGVQFATFSPFFQDHGSAQAPWEQTKYGQQNYAFYTKVRYNLMPYLKALVHSAHTVGLPMMRPLFFYHPMDSQSWKVNDEYYFGQDLLVAPVLHTGTTRKIYFPPGEWVDLLSNKVYSGGEKIIYNAPLNRIPVFVKKEACLPLALNQNLHLGGDFNFRDKDNLLTTYEIFASTAQTYNFLNKDSTYFLINFNPLSKKILKLKLHNTKGKVGLIIHCANPRKILIDGDIIAKWTLKSFAKADKGWYYDKNTHKLKIKVGSTPDDLTLTIKGSELFKKQYEHGENIAQTPKLVVPENVHIKPYDGSVDISFDRVNEDKGLTYIIKSPQGRYLMPPGTGNNLTINGLKNGMKYGFRLLTSDWSGVSLETPLIEAVPGNKKPIHQFKSEETFIRGNHFSEKKQISTDSTEYIYSINNLSEAHKIKIWAKVEKNTSIHFQYPRWYPVRIDTLKKGKQIIKLQFPKNYQLAKIYLTKRTEERPMFKEKTEVTFVHKK